MRRIACIALLLGVFCTFLLTTPVSAAGPDLPSAPCGSWQAWMPSMLSIYDSTGITYIGSMTGLQDNCGNKVVLAVASGSAANQLIISASGNGGYYSTYAPPNTWSWWSDVLAPSYTSACVFLSVNTYQGTKYGSRCFP